MRYFIEVSYNGQAYHGWQVQKNAHTVQQEINDALGKYFRQLVETVGSGRTDAGVHARQQFCHFDLPEPLDIPQTVHKLNAILPPDIAVLNIFRVADDAHARFHALSRSYEYHIISKKDPFLKDTSYYFRVGLVLDQMNEACNVLKGKQDFQSFSKVRTSVDNFFCTITRAQWKFHNGTVCFYVSANRFLRGMVRALVGTMLDVGTGKITVEQFQNILESGDRRAAGRSVPAQGLVLTKVEYPEYLLRSE